jgi:hypothetical protein
VLKPITRATIVPCGFRYSSLPTRCDRAAGHIGPCGGDLRRSRQKTHATMPGSTDSLRCGRTRAGSVEIDQLSPTCPGCAESKRRADEHERACIAYRDVKPENAAARDAREDRELADYVLDTEGIER